MYVDIKTWLVDDILVKVDQTSMAHSLEVRAPFLDHHLVEFAAGLPVDWKLNGLEARILAQKGLREPTCPVHQGRQEKGFNAPVAEWLNGPLGEVARQATLGSKMAEWIDTTKVETLWAEHASKRYDHGFKLFALTCLGLWMETS